MGKDRFGGGGRSIGEKGYSMVRFLVSSLLVVLLSASCARETPYITKSIPLPEAEKGVPRESYVVNGIRYYPLPDAVGFVQTGKASWYGKKFHGRKTSNGETYDMNGMTAAHKTLPMNTYVKVVNLSNQHHTIVRINDRGPFVKGRVIDLSYAAARDIRLVGPGVVDVKIVALGKEIQQQGGQGKTKKTLIELKDLDKGVFTIQVGAFQEKENAVRLAQRLKVIFDYVHVKEYLSEDGKVFYRVQVSKSNSLNRAESFEKKLEDMGFTEAFIVRI